MGDKGKILFGLAIFVILITFPFWGRLSAGDALPGRAELEYPANEEACVEDTPFMRASHMDLLNQWRDDLVRDGNMEEYVSELNGRTYPRSLTKTGRSGLEVRVAVCTRVSCRG